MSSAEAPSRSRNLAGIALAYVLALYAAWGGAWLLSRWLENQGILPGLPFDRFVYWLIMRILLWVIPSVAIIRGSGRSVREVLGAGRVKQILLWGGIIGLIWGGKTPLFNMLTNKPVHPIVLDWSFVTAVLYAPLVEEITFRGAVMGSLETRMSFLISNLLTGVLFLLVHFPGWYFDGFLSSGTIAVASAAIGILLLGWIFGYIAHKSKSVVASTLAHMLNNFFQRFVS
jgi:membrane protease YdiL (CAAX protease family)